jgi:hypothetical protein
VVRPEWLLLEYVWLVRIPPANADFRGKEFDPNSGVLKAELAATPPGNVDGGDDGLAQDG